MLRNVRSKPHRFCLGRNYVLLIGKMNQAYKCHTVRILCFEQCFKNVVHRLIGVAGHLIIGHQFSEKVSGFFINNSETPNATINIIFFVSFQELAGIRKTHGTERYSTNHCGRTGSKRNLNIPNEVVLNRASRAFMKIDRSFGCKQFASRLKPHFTTFSIVYKIAICFN